MLIVDSTKETGWALEIAGLGDMPLESFGIDVSKEGEDKSTGIVWEYTADLPSEMIPIQRYIYKHEFKGIHSFEAEYQDILVPLPGTIFAYRVIGDKWELQPDTKLIAVERTRAVAIELSLFVAMGFAGYSLFPLVKALNVTEEVCTTLIKSLLETKML